MDVSFAFAIASFIIIIIWSIELNLNFFSFFQKKNFSKWIKYKFCFCSTWSIDFNYFLFLFACSSSATAEAFEICLFLSRILKSIIFYRQLKQPDRQSNIDNCEQPYPPTEKVFFHFFLSINFKIDNWKKIWNFIVIVMIKSNLKWMKKK